METESAIPPFVFVDGRKYILAEDEELPERELLTKLTCPPRNISALVRWRLYLRQETDLYLLALYAGVLGSACTLRMFGVEAVLNGLMLTFTIVMLPYAYIAASRIYSGRHETMNVLRLLQIGLASCGRLVDLISTGKKVDNAVEIQLKYQFTTHEGSTFNTSFCTANINTIMKLSSETQKIIFYDPAQPRRNILFDALPEGIEFDDLDGIFRTNLSFLMTQLLWLCFMIAILPMICLFVFIFLC